MPVIYTGYYWLFYCKSSGSLDSLPCRMTTWRYLTSRAPTILLWMFSTLGTKSFDYKRNWMRLETIWYRNHGNLLVFKAIRLVAWFTIEMNMSIGMIAGAVMTAELIINYTTAILESMNYIVLQKHWHNPKYAGLVHIREGILQCRETHWLMHIK